MNSSGNKRRLALTAVAALAASGAALLPTQASAESVDFHTGACQIDFFSFAYGWGGSVKDDGTNTTVTLEAGAGNDIPQVTFQYDVSGGAVSWVDINTTSRNDNGAFKHDWAVPGSLLGVPIDVRAVGNTTNPTVPNCGDTVTQRVSNVAAGVAVEAASSLQTEAIEATTGDRIGIYQSPMIGGGTLGDYIAVNGTTSAENGAVVYAEALGAGGVDSGNVFGAVAGGMFNVPFDINGFGAYTWDPSVPQLDQVSLRPFIQDTSSGSWTADVETYEVYKQTLGSIEAQPAGGPISDAPGATKQVLLTVKDTEGKPIAGAEIYVGGALQADNRPRPDGLITQTDGNGQIRVAQGQGTVNYYVNATSTAGYAAGVGDKQVSVTFTPYVAKADDLVGASRDGAAFDRDEYFPGDQQDISVQVVDPADEAFDPTDTAGTRQDLVYRWRITPLAGGATVTTAAANVDAEANGKFIVPLPTPAQLNLPQGSQLELLASLLGDGGGNGAIAEKSVLTVKVGESQVIYDGIDPQWADVNTSATVTGKLQLSDGTPLPGRRLALAWTRGAAANGDDPTPDTFLDSPTPVVTSATGGITAKITDVPDGPELSELGGRLQATSLPQIGGDADSTLDVHLAWWHASASSHGVDFVTSAVPATAVIDVRELAPVAPFELQPGNVYSGELLLTNGGVPLKGRKVVLTVDHGFFTDGTEVRTAGAYGPVRKDLTTTITVATDSTGKAVFWTTIARDAGFDDDGKVTQRVTGTVGAATDGHDFKWNTIDSDGQNLSYNIDAIEIVKTPEEDQSGPTDPARIGQPVEFDVYAKDQFGNLVKGITPAVDCTDDEGGDDGAPCQAGGFSTSSDYDDGGDLTVNSGLEGVWNFAATYNAPNERYTGPGLPLTPVNEVKTDTFSQEWYAVDIDGSTFTLATSPANPVEPGEPVTVTLTALDPEGRPLDGVRVDFIRTGDSDTETQNLFTDEDGVATYVYEVEECAFEDTITAVVRDTVVYDGDPNSGGVIKQESTEVVSVDCEPTEDAEVNLNLSGLNSENGRRDIINVTATSVADLTGVPVVLQKKVDGKWRQVGADGRTLDSDGKARFSVRDTNGNAVSRYRVKALATDATLQSFSEPLLRR